MPRSSAFRRAAGLTGAVLVCSRVAVVGSVSGFAGGGAAAGSAAAVSATSPPSMVAITVPIGTVSPTGTTMCRMPEASAFNSTLTLSVSSSQIISSLATVAPSSFNQLATRASRIDSPTSGIFISIFSVLVVQCAVNDLLLLFAMAAMGADRRGRCRPTTTVVRFSSQGPYQAGVQMWPRPHVVWFFLDPGNAAGFAVTGQHLLQF